MTVDLIKKSIYAGLGGAIAALLLLWLSDVSGYVLIMAPFGASCVILFALPESPLAQPKNVVGGHVLTALVGLLALYFLPQSIWVTALAVGVGIAVMVVSKTIPPPAGANPLLILLSGKTFAWSFLMFPVAIGAVLLVCVAAAFHSIATRSRYQLPAFSLLRGKNVK